MVKDDEDEVDEQEAEGASADKQPVDEEIKNAEVERGGTEQEERDDSMTQDDEREEENRAETLQEEKVEDEDEIESTCGMESDERAEDGRADCASWIRLGERGGEAGAQRVCGEFELGMFDQKLIGAEEAFSEVSPVAIARPVVAVAAANERCCESHPSGFLHRVSRVIE